MKLWSIYLPVYKDTMLKINESNISGCTSQHIIGLLRNHVYESENGRVTIQNHKSENGGVPEYKPNIVRVCILKYLTETCSMKENQFSMLPTGGNSDNKYITV